MPEDDSPLRGTTLRIQGSNFSSKRGIRVTNKNVIHEYASKDAMQILKEHVAFGALFNSDERYDPPKCHPDTRKAVLDNLEQWALDSEVSSPVTWLYGAAGIGKSAIAQSIAERLNETRVLAASIFLWRTAAMRNEKRYIIPTIAYQLMLAVPSTRTYIESVINRDVGIFEKSLRTQMSELVVRPLLAVSSNDKVYPMVIVIDGLDECSVDYPQQNHEEQQREILDAISFSVQHKGFPIRFLIASRPERQIRERFGEEPLRSVATHLRLDHIRESNADIELYIRCKFKEIAHLHPHLVDWPSDDAILELVHRSSGQFLYAAVAMRSLATPRINSEASLQALLGVTMTPDRFDKPFAILDALYMHILTSVSADSLLEVMNIFSIIAYGDALDLRVPLFTGVERLSPCFLAKYLFTSVGEIYRHLVDLHSILDIPPAENSGSAAVTFIHASFTEFLTDPSRSSSFFLHPIRAQLCLQSIRMRHVLTQLLSDDGGQREGYLPRGFAHELRWWICDSGLPPSRDVGEGLLALVTPDQEWFENYVRRIHLGHRGFLRNETYLRFLFNQPNRLESILSYLKKCGIEENEFPTEEWWVHHGDTPNSNVATTKPHIDRTSTTGYGLLNQRLQGRRIVPGALLGAILLSPLVTYALNRL